MKIIVCGTQCNGKTTLVDNIRNIWPKYKSPIKSYREVVKERNLKLNKEGDVDSQRIIRDILIDQVVEMSGETHVVYDRSIIDNIAYTLHGVEKGRIADENFIADSINICRELMKVVDIVFWLPINHNIIITEQENRDIDPVFREEIDVIFQGIYDSYLNNDGTLFDPNNQPPMIMLDGDLQQKINTIAEYIGPDGDLVDTQESILTSLADEYDKLDILNKLK